MHHGYCENTVYVYVREVSYAKHSVCFFDVVENNIIFFAMLSLFYDNILCVHYLKIALECALRVSLFFSSYLVFVRYRCTARN